MGRRRRVGVGGCFTGPRTPSAGRGRLGLFCPCPYTPPPPPRAKGTFLMVDYNLIHSLGQDLDDEVNSAVATALGDAANDLSKLVTGDEVQDFSPGAIIKGRISSVVGD